AHGRRPQFLDAVRLHQRGDFFDDGAIQARPLKNEMRHQYVHETNKRGARGEPKKAPTLRLRLAAPRGGAFCLGAARRQKSPHAAPSAGCPPRGRFLPWAVRRSGCPAAKNCYCIAPTVRNGARTKRLASARAPVFSPDSSCYDEAHRKTRTLLCTSGPTIPCWIC